MPWCGMGGGDLKRSLAPPGSGEDHDSLSSLKAVKGYLSDGLLVQPPEKCDNQ